MGKQYISTVSAAQAHKSDISAVAMTNKYTITVSSDGHASFWDNKQDEVHTPQDFVIQKLIDPIGIHHVAVFEDVPSGSTTRFYKDPLSTKHRFVATKTNGTTVVYELNLIVAEDGAVSVDVSTESGVLNASNIFTSFPNALSISPTEDALCAVGYTSGDVVVYSIKSHKQVFTFHSTDLQVKQGKGSTSVPRALAFSPGGSILVVARDNQSAGSITLYDVKYGENVGSLTTSTHSSKTTIGGFAHEGWIMGLSFNEDGSLLASCGFDKCVRVWNLESREREATIQVNVTDLEDTTHDEVDSSICSGVSFIKKGVRGGPGGDSNEGLCVVSFDRGIRWYREAGGI
ncbi:hypothetical protein JCM33374_g4671 [Metschnikowia sp. JCM 33374]|nr:hypothetical protein JCM33374_g4671 [Metschnikowia sp. JCM 33374]